MKYLRRLMDKKGRVEKEKTRRRRRRVARDIILIYESLFALEAGRWSESVLLAAALAGVWRGHNYCKD